MAATTVRGAQILDGTVQRDDLDISTTNQAVVRRLVQGSGITLSSTGVQSGTGDVTITGTAGATPTGTGYYHTTSGVMDAAADTTVATIGLAAGLALALS